MKNADEILFRCSSLGHLMTEPKKKSETLSEGTKTHLVDVFVSAMYHRREEITSKFLTKGNAREEDAITLLSRVTKTLYKKNTERLSNHFITGEPDVYEGESIRKAATTTDTKTSWSAHTFFRAKMKEVDPMYYWQGQGYMILTGAKHHTVAPCLVNGTDTAIMDEKRKAGYSLGMMDAHGNPTEEYIAKCKQIEINHIFDLTSFKNEYPWFQFDNDLTEWKYDIPMEQRLHRFTFERNEEDIVRLYKRIADCRKWMNENLFKTFQSVAA